MTHDSFINYWRLANALLGAVAFIWLLMRVNSKWGMMNAEERAGRAVLMLFAFATAYGSGEAARQNAPAGLRTAFYSLALLALLLHLFMLTYKTYHPRYDGSRGGTNRNGDSVA